MNKKRNISDKCLMEDMDAYQLSRWLALFEGINIVADAAEKEGKSFGYMHIKQPALEEYVDSTSVLIYRELTGKEMR